MKTVTVPVPDGAAVRVDWHVSLGHFWRLRGAYMPESEVRVFYRDGTSDALGADRPRTVPVDFMVAEGQIDGRPVKLFGAAHSRESSVLVTASEDDDAPPF